MSEQGGASQALWSDADAATSARRYRTLVSAVGDGVCHLDPEGRFVDADAAFADLLDADREALVGSRATAVVDDGVAERLESAARSLRESDGTADVEMSPTATGDGVGAVTLRLTPLVEDGEHLGVVCIASDRGRGPARPDAAFQPLSNVLDAADVGLVVYDADGEVARATGAVARHLGLDPATVRGRPRDAVIREIREHVADGDRFAAAASRREADDGGSVAGESAPFRMPGDGEADRWYEFRSRPVGAGQFAGGRVDLLLEVTDGERTDGVAREQELREREDQLRERGRELEWFEGIVENLPVGVYRNTPGPEGEFVEANSTLAEIFDADSVEEFTSHNVSDLYADPEERIEFSRTLEEQGIVRDYELKQETLAGRTIWISVTAIKTEEDGDVYFDGIVQDITDRKRREQELKRYETLFTESRDVNVVLDADGTYEYVTPSAENVLGYEPGDLLGEVAFEYVHPDDRERVATEYATLVEDPDHEPTVEYRFRHADGHWIWLESRGRNLLEDPDIGGIVVYSREVTDRRERERQLEERERQLSMLMANVPGIVYRCRNERGWPMEFVSEGCRDLTGYDPGALERGDVSFGGDVVHEDDREQLWTDVQDGLADDGSFLVTYRIRTASGDVRWVRERGRGIYEHGDLAALEGVIIDITDRKRLESELDEVFGRVTDAFYALDDQWRFTFVNERAAELLGEPVEALHGRVVWDVFPGAVGTDLEDHFRRAMATQEPVSFERHSDALGIWEAVHVYPSETGLSVYFRDVTERRERERELQRKERRFEAVFEDPNILVGLLEPDGTVLDINQTAMEYIDADLASVRDQPFWETPWWGEGEGVRDRVKEWTERAAAGEYVDFEADLTRPDGEPYALSGYFRPVTDDGDVISIIVSDRDVTERKERERELERALDLLNKTERIADVAGWEVLPESREVFWSDHLFDLLDVEYDEQPTLEEALDVYHTEADRAVVEEAVEEALETGESFDVEARFPRPAGDVGWLRVQGDPEVEDGEVASLRGAVQDVTEQRQRERQLEELVDRLEASNERLEQFAYAASHDLQEPLRMVSSYLSLIERRYGDTLDEDGQEFLAFAVDGAERMREMIDALLEYSRVETRGNPMEPVDLEDVLADVRRDFRMRIEETDADVEVGSLPTVRGDGDQLRQVFGNLLDNAIEYSGDEPPRVEVYEASEDAPPGARTQGPGEARDRVTVAVSDDGIGIDPEHADHIFQVFQRLHTHDEHAGTGIGLALCRRIVERHGGDISVASEPGEGSTFYVTLPAGETGD